MSPRFFPPTTVLALALLLPTAALAVPDGYTEGSAVVAGTSVNGALCMDATGALLFCHDADLDYRPESIYRVDPQGGTPALFAQGLGSVASIVSDGAGVLYVGDNDDTAGNAVWKLVDGNADQDCLDPGEVTLYATAPDLDNLADLALAADGTLYATDADGYGAGDLFILEDLNGDGDCLDNVAGRDETRVWATDVEHPPSGFLGGILVDESGPYHQVLYQDSSGTIDVAADLSADGDADDPGEVVAWVSGLTGGIDMIWSPDHLSIFASGTLFGGGSTIEQISLMGTVQPFHAFDPGVVSWAGALVFQDPVAPFAPYSGPGANVLHMCWSDLGWLSAAETWTATPLDAPETPATDLAGLLVLGGVLGLILQRRRK